MLVWSRSLAALTSMYGRIYDSLIACDAVRGLFHCFVAVQLSILLVKRSPFALLTMGICCFKERDERKVGDERDVKGEWSSSEQAPGLYQSGTNGR